MMRRLRMGVAAWLLVGVLSGGVADGQTDISKFPLMKAVPADVFIAVAGKGNPERQFLCDYWAEVTQEFLDQEILEDIWDMITDAVPDESLEEIEATRERFVTLLKEVEWGQLFDKEMIYAGRFYSAEHAPLAYEGLLVGRLSKKAAAANYASLKGILEEIDQFVATKAGVGKVAVTETKKGGVTLTKFGPAETPNVGITLAHKKDLVLMSFGGSAILHDALDLLKGDSEKKRLTRTSRFKKAFAKLPAAEDSIVFFDIEGMLRPIRTMVQSVVASHSHSHTHEGNEEEGDEEAEEPPVSEEAVLLGVVSGLLDDISLLDTMAAVEWTEGYRVFSETIVTVRPDAKSNPLYKVVAGNKPIRKYQKYIPKEAESFSCTSGINLSRLYRYLLGVVEKAVPGGEEKVAEFERMQKEEWELDIDKDVLKLFAGPMLEISMGNDWVILAKVTDEEKASQLVSRLLEGVNGLLGEQNALGMTEIEILGEEGFIQISHPMMLMMGGLRPPVVGCADGHLILGSSASAVTTCLQTGRGKHPNITKNKRWRAEALVPKKGNVDAISFTDQENMASDLQQGIGAVSMGLSVIGMFAPELPPKARDFISELPPLLTKLAPVVGKLDFYKSTASYSSFDGKQWHTRSVQNYKKPKPKSAADDEEAQEAQDDDA